MNKKNQYTQREDALLKKMDAVLELSLTHEAVLSHVPAFNDKIQLLREKRNLVTDQSVVKYQANRDKSAIVNDFAAEKLALIDFVNRNLGSFKEYAKSENDATLTTSLATVALSVLKKHKPMDLVTVLKSFAADVKKLKAERLAYHGLENNWATTLEEKTTYFNDLLPKKETSKSNKPLETNNFKSIINDINDIKTSLDNLIIRYETVNPEFYIGYLRATGTLNAVIKKANKSAKAKAKSKPKAKTETEKTLLSQTKPKTKRSRKKVAEVVIVEPVIEHTDTQTPAINQ